MINFHPFDRPSPSTNPLYIEHQYKKYQFFLNNKYKLKFGIYLHKYTTNKQIIDFYQYIIQHNFNPKNFMVFSRKQQNNVNYKWNWIILPD